MRLQSFCWQRIIFLSSVTKILMVTHWAVLLHLFNNLVLADLLTRLTSQWSEMAFGTLNLALFGGGALVSLVILIRNRADIRAYRRSEWMDRRCIRCFATAAGILALTVLMCGNMLLLFMYNK